MNVQLDNLEVTLRSINRRLADLLNTEALPLAQGGARAMADPLWVWGIAGGKDVGKTTLINALAGADVVPPGTGPGEGTYHPAAYLTPDDAVALEARFAELDGMTISYHADAAPTMRGVVLVDLPDFDSLFEAHVEQVRRIATVLDGMIWVTTPKKIGDLRGISEIQQVLKARSNFVYAVNKIDWLLGQADGPPQAELDRAAAALQQQVQQCDPAGDSGRTFLISAKYHDTRAVLEAISRQRNQPGDERAADENGELTIAAQRVVDDFQALRRALTTAPTAEAGRANKRANLAYQIRRQARQLLEYHQPLPVLRCLERAADPEAIRDHVTRAFHPAYCDQVYRRLNAARPLLAQWSAELFKARIARWPLLGIIAWPVALFGFVLGGLRSLLPNAAGVPDADPFRTEGLALEDRAEAILARLKSELASVTRRVTLDLPEAQVLARQFRGEAAALAREQRSAVMEPWLHRTPSLLGRWLRWLLPLAVLLWFPLVQPLLLSFLQQFESGVQLDLELAGALVAVLSAHNVLVGLCTSLIILAVLVAAVYSRAVRDAQAAMGRLESTSAEAVGAALPDSLAETLRRPIEKVRASLAEITESLDRLAEGTTST